MNTILLVLALVAPNGDLVSNGTSNVTFTDVGECRAFVLDMNSNFALTGPIMWNPEDDTQFVIETEDMTRIYGACVVEEWI